MAGNEPAPEILIIEDDAGIGQFLVDLLHLHGYRAAAATDGAALDRVIPTAPRLIFLDLMLPNLDGGEICRRLRAEPRTRDIPIAIMTAAAPATIARLLRGCAYDALLRKPFDIDEALAIAARHARRGDAGPHAAGEAALGGVVG